MSPSTYNSGPMAPQPARPATVADVLDAAADHIQQYGHCKDVYRETDGRCCTAGAINWAIAGDEEAFIPSVRDSYELNRAAKRAMISALPSFADEARFTLDDLIGRWNDAPGRTADEVIATLRRVALEHRDAGRIHDPAQAFDDAHAEYRDRARCDGGQWCRCRGNDGRLKQPRCPQRWLPCTRTADCWRTEGHGGNCQHRDQPNGGA